MIESYWEELNIFLDLNLGCCRNEVSYTHIRISLVENLGSRNRKFTLETGRKPKTSLHESTRLSDTYRDYKFYITVMVYDTSMIMGTNFPVLDTEEEYFQYCILNKIDIKFSQMKVLKDKIIKIKDNEKINLGK